MNVTSSSFRNTACSRFPKEEDFKKIARARQGGIRSRLINFLKPGCLGKAISKKTRPLNEPEKQMQLLQNKCQITTLGDWFLASPTLNHNYIKESDFCSPKPTKNAVHLSIDTEKKFKTMKESIKLDNGCSPRSGNTIKRVQFRIPEVVDVFIINPPKELVKSQAH
ncbi:hypothetical protein LIER_34048 [Lithospermum erythrorhizon]|uniref:Uncharacterized protein n=1 Tax=Lithospermum erythrorhizon TaxID=34254 RepID=A0AAV3S0U9_LITER